MTTNGKCAQGRCVDGRIYHWDTRENRHVYDGLCPDCATPSEKDSAAPKINPNGTIRGGDPGGMVLVDDSEIEPPPQEGAVSVALSGFYPGPCPECGKMLTHNPHSLRCFTCMGKTAPPPQEGVEGPTAPTPNDVELQERLRRWFRRRTREREGGGMSPHDQQLLGVFLVGFGLGNWFVIIMVKYFGGVIK